MSLEDWTNQTLSGCIEGWAAREPDRLALSGDDLVLSYGDLHAQATELARILIAEGAGPETRVVLLLPDRASLVIAWLAVLKSGAVCVPVFPRQPRNRIEAILEDAEPVVLITDATSRELLGAQPIGESAMRILDVDHLPALDPGTASDLEFPVLASEANAYLLYTSGTTGRPKGVLQSHRNLLRNVHGLRTLVGISPEDRFVGLTSFSMGQGVATLFCALLHGAALFPFDLRKRGVASLADWCRRHRITIYTSAVSVFRAFAKTLSSEGSCPDLRVVRLGAEELQPPDVALFQEGFAGDCTLFNTLGCTETMNYCSFRIDNEWSPEGTTVPVGFPPEAIRIHLVDPAGREVPAGEVGEIVVESDYLSPGYWRQEALTDQRFFRTKEGTRCFRTGDRGRFRPDGALECQGRVDHQVQVRGFRIELGDIESVAQAHPEIRGAAAILSSERADELILHVATDLPESDLRSFLEAELPDYMIPSRIVCGKDLPLAPSGKVDRVALSVRESSSSDNRSAGGEGTLPETPWEIRIADCWKRVLDLPEIDVNADFAHLGGSSLDVLHVFAEIQKTHGIRFQAIDIFDAFTVRHMAAKVAEMDRDSKDAANGFLLPLRDSGERAPAYLFPGGWGGENEVLLFAAIARQLETDRPLVAVKSRALDPEMEESQDHDEADHLPAHASRVLRELGEGREPDLLVGECVAGVLALEIAAQREAAGVPAGTVVLLDPWMPDPASDGPGREGGEAASSPPSDPERAEVELPPAIRRYYEMLKRARLPRIQGTLHLVSTSDSGDPAELSRYWQQCTEGEFHLHAVAGDHDSFIREDSEETIAVLNRILREDASTSD